MRIDSRICMALNRFFPLPVHPFNLQNQGVKTYAQWQFDRGIETVRFFLDAFSLEEMFEGKTVLDIGCGAGGKTLYYASRNAEIVYGIEIVPEYKDEAEALAREKELSDKFRFVLGDASKLPFADSFFDTIIMNDAMEHVNKPLDVLNECCRVLKPGGRLYINFPPYYHPFGAHLSDAIGIPWVHLFFKNAALIEAYKQLVKDLPDGARRIRFRISTDSNGHEFFSYINGMTISWFNDILSQTRFKVSFYKEVPLRSFLKPLSKLPVLKEGLIKMVACTLEKKDTE